MKSFYHSACDVFRKYCRKNRSLLTPRRKSYILCDADFLYSLAAVSLHNLHPHPSPNFGKREMGRGVLVSGYKSANYFPNNSWEIIFFPLDLSLWIPEAIAGPHKSQKLRHLLRLLSFLLLLLHHSYSSYSSGPPSPSEHLCYCCGHIRPTAASSLSLLTPFADSFPLFNLNYINLRISFFFHS